MNVGQTVTAGLNTPSIFLIAKDLRKMEIWVLVNEMDIGSIELDMPVSFTVPKCPKTTFHGTVSEMRKDAVMTSNVVTYTVVVTADNPDRELLPYSTANVRFEVSRKSGVLTVPNAALQWEPKSEQIAPGYEAETTESNGSEEEKRIWLADGERVRPLAVVIGITDGVATEISGEGVTEGMKVVVGETAAEIEEESEDTSVPFMPKFPKGKKRPPPPG